jgi:hypothetical protein
LSKFISFSHDNLLIFAKDKERLDFNRLPRSAKMDKAYKIPMMTHEVHIKWEILLLEKLPKTDMILLPQAEK